MRVFNVFVNCLQRDYFGAHTYELETAPGSWVHTNWTGRGGRVASSTYQA
jgi:6-phosphogluconate dehydrogenase